MKITRTLAYCLLLFLTNQGISQKVYSNVFELNTNIGFSNDFNSLGQYGSFSLNEIVSIEEKSAALVRSFGISFSRYLSEWGGIKLSIGQLKYGFDFKGTTLFSNTSVSDFYRITYVDFSLEILNRTPLSKNVKLLVNAGVHYNSDPSPRPGTIFLSTVNSYSSSIYAGLEYPMFGQHFFINTGLQFRFPLKRYNRVIQTDKKYLPYFIGLKLGVNYQF